jgi:BolA protein
MLARVMAASVQQPRPLQSSMQRKLESALSPVVLKIINESYKHAGHSGNPTGAPDAETHFR